MIFALMLAACGSSTETAVPFTPAPTDTTVPTQVLTATPTIPLATLIVPADMDPDISNQYQKTVYDLAQASGMRFQVRNSLTPAELEPGLKIVISLPPDPGIAELAAAAPDVQFLAINIPGLTPGGNISVLGANSQTEIAAFTAGYTAAMVTDDYRIGMLMPKGDENAIRSLNSYNNGMVFYCGICRPFYYLPWSFPQYLEIPPEEDVNNYDAYADILIMQYKVRTIFIHSGIYTQDLVDYIGTTGTTMIGTISPEQLPAGWIMTIQPDTIKAIQSAWPQLIAGQGGVTVQSPLGLTDIDPSLLTLGKQRLSEETLGKLQTGLIAP
jgi:hypothetical protein